MLLPLYSKDNPTWFRMSLESVLSQRDCIVEIHIGIDGPIPKSLSSVLDEYSDDSRVILHQFSENRGLACVLNDLLSSIWLSHIEYIARMDADDISLPDRFISQITFLKQNPEVDVVGCNISEIDENSTSKGKIIRYPKTHTDCRKHFRYRDPLAHPAVMFRRCFFNKVEGYRREFRKNQDTMLWFDGFLNGCIFANVDKVLLNFRVTNDFYNRRNGINRALQMLRNRIEINKELKYDISANIFALGMFIMTISPTFVKKFLYRIRT